MSIWYLPLTILCQVLKPIFHRDAKLLHWGFALGQPHNAKIRIGNTNMLVSKNTKICVTPNANAKICVTPTRNLNASQWNIGCVGCPTQNSRVGHVDFMLFIPFFSRWVTLFSVEYGLYCNTLTALKVVWSLFTIGQIKSEMAKSCNTK